jgi:hypothetical protein
VSVNGSDGIAWTNNGRGVEVIDSLQLAIEFDSCSCNSNRGRSFGERGGGRGISIWLDFHNRTMMGRGSVDGCRVGRIDFNESALSRVSNECRSRSWKRSSWNSGRWA